MYNGFIGGLGIEGTGEVTERTRKLYKEVTERTDMREPTSLNFVGTGDQDNNVTSMDQ